MLDAVLRHFVCQAPIQVVFDAFCSSQAFRRLLTNNLCLYWPLRGERLCDGFRLEPNNCFCKQRVNNSTSSLPRIGAFFNLQTKKLQPFAVRLFPHVTRPQIFFVLRNQFRSERINLATRGFIRKNGFKQVGVMVIFNRIVNFYLKPLFHRHDDFDIDTRIAAFRDVCDLPLVDTISHGAITRKCLVNHF